MAGHERRSLWMWWTEASALRWGLVVLLVLAAVVASFVGGFLEVCEQQLAQTGDSGVVEVCRRPSMSDPAVLGFVLLILVVVWPDLSEVSIGVFKLTRKVDEQAARTEQVGREVNDLRQTLSLQVAQVSQQVSRVSQQAVQQQVASPQAVVYVGTAATTREPQEVTTAAAPAPGVPVEEVLEPVRRQPAYAEARVPAAWQLLEGRELDPVRVAIVGAGIHPGLHEVEGLRSHVQQPYTATGAAGGPVGPTGNSSLGHILAIAPSAVVYPVGVLGSNYGMSSSNALFEGITAALVQRPQVLLLGLSSPPIPEVEQLLAGRGNELLIVAPAGNSQESTSAWPGIISGVASVASLTTARERAAFSNYGTGVDLAAPGVDITVLVDLTADGEPNFGKLSGTTVSADIVAGVAALLLATRRVEPSEILGILRATAAGRTTEGLPILDTAAAVESALS
jgi:subtilisin family serine protease